LGFAILGFAILGFAILGFCYFGFCYFGILLFRDFAISGKFSPISSIKGHDTGSRIPSHFPAMQSAVLKIASPLLIAKPKPKPKPKSSPAPKPTDVISLSPPALLARVASSPKPLLRPLAIHTGRNGWIQDVYEDKDGSWVLFWWNIRSGGNSAKIPEIFRYSSEEKELFDINAFNYDHEASVTEIEY
jgi:hypothetical protein